MISIKKLSKLLDIKQSKLTSLLKDKNLLITYPYINPIAITQGNARYSIAKVGRMQFPTPNYRVSYVLDLIEGREALEPIADKDSAVAECEKHIQIQRDKAMGYIPVDEVF